MTEDAETTVEGLGNAIGLLESRENDTKLAWKTFTENVKELTGCDPQKAVTVFDVVKIVHKIWGDPK